MGKVKALEAHLRSLGLPGMDAVAQSLADALAPGLDEQGRLDAAALAYGAVLEEAATLLEGELRKVKSMQARPEFGPEDQQALLEMHAAFTLQLSGFTELRACLGTADAGRMALATQNIREGGAAAVRVARDQMKRSK